MELYHGLLLFKALTLITIFLSFSNLHLQYQTTSINNTDTINQQAATSFIEKTSDDDDAISQQAATSFIKSTCDETTHVDVCLNILLPNADRIKGNPKKATRLAIMATLSHVRSTSKNISDLFEILYPSNLTCDEMKCLFSCQDTTIDKVEGLLDAIEATHHLGSGDDEESKKLSIASKIRIVVSATHSCMNCVERSPEIRMGLIPLVREAMEPLAQVATNALDLIHSIKL